MQTNFKVGSTPSRQATDMIQSVGSPACFGLCRHIEETRPRAEDASRVPRRADPVAECDLAEVSPPASIYPRTKIGVAGQGVFQ